MVQRFVCHKNPPDGTHKAVVIMRTLRRIVAVGLTCMLLAPPLPAAGQDASKPAFKPEELDQLVAPIALHPDALLAQILMASTYPLEVVEAARFAKENAKLSPDQLAQALQSKTWDDSVKSLVTFPQVLTMMNDKLDWLQKLGDAFLAQQSDLLAAVQRLRHRAQAEGQLKSTKEQNVIVEPVAAAPAGAPPAGAPPPGAVPPPGSAPAPGAAPAPPTNVQVQQAPPTTVQVQQAPANVQVVQAPPTTTVIKIEPANPQVVYVPSYDPTVVYGGFPPAYPPYYPYPPGYFATSALMFGAGMAVGAAMWGDCDWGGGHGDANVSINNSNNNYNNFSNRVNDRDTARNRTERNRAEQRAGGRSNWQHNPEHRKGVQYRDAKTQQRFNRTGPGNAQAREQFRGRTPSTQPAAGRGGGVGGGAQAATRDVARPAAGGAGQGGGIGGAGIGQGGATTREVGAGGGIGQGGGSFGQGAGGIGQGGGFQGGGRTGAFEGMGNGRATQSFSDRGNASRQSFQRSGGGGGGGGARGGGGGGGRGGGGGGGRGGRR
jgi:hypothetical protein